MVGSLDRAGGDLVFLGAPGCLAGLGKVVLHGRDNEKPASQAEGARGRTSWRYSSRVCHQPRPFQVTVQPSWSAAALFRRSTIICDSLIAQAAMACTCGVLSDDGLEDDEGEAGIGGFLDAGAVEGKLAGGFAPRVAEGDACVRGRHIEAVGIDEIMIEIGGQAVVCKAVVVAFDEAHGVGRAIRNERQQVGWHGVFPVRRSTGVGFGAGSECLGGLACSPANAGEALADAIEFRGIERGPPGIAGGLNRDDLVVNEAPEHAFDVAFHGVEECVAGEIINENAQEEELLRFALKMCSQQVGLEGGAGCCHADERRLVPHIKL